MGRSRFPPRGWRDFAWQLGLWLAFALVYELVRGVADRGRVEALTNAYRLIDAERALRIDVELDLQQAALDVELLLDAVNWSYWLAQFAVLGLALLWIYVFRTESFLVVRNTVFAANLLGLVCFALFPTAPPRLVPETGLIDTLALHAAVDHDTDAVALAANPYAAMPSLHAADALIVGVALAVLVRSPVLKTLWLLWPVWVAFALVATGNHFLLDIAAGALVAFAGGVLAWKTQAWFSRTGGRRPTRRRPRREPARART